MSIQKEAYEINNNTLGMASLLTQRGLSGVTDASVTGVPWSDRCQYHISLAWLLNNRISAELDGETLTIFLSHTSLHDWYFHGDS